MVHNYYRESGGEDQSFRAEVELLRAHGHTVNVYTRDNQDINENGIFQKIQLARRTVWAEDTLQELGEMLSNDKPDVAHFQNTFPLISPSAYSACRQAGVPVIQSLRNYRLLCPNALFYRSARPCEDCLGKTVPWPGVLHKCYRGSRSQSAVVTGMLAYHNLIGTWYSKVDAYIALSEFSRAKFIEGGLPSNKIHVKPNFVSDPGGDFARDDYAVFVGRLSVEKGLDTLLDAWRGIKDIPLKIIGMGPMHGAIAERLERENLDNITLSGQLSHADTMEVVGHARLLVFPSEWYETFGRVIVEAYSAGVPVVASRLGAAAALVRDGETGLLFTPGDSTDLANKVESVWNYPEGLARMGWSARLEYEQKYTPEGNYSLLIDIYEKAIGGGS